MMPSLDHLRLLFRLHPGWYALLASLMLTTLGIAAIATVRPDDATQQLKFWLPVALLAMTICIFPHPRILGHLAYPALLASIIVLAFMIAPGVPRSIVPIINGAKCWINLGFMSVQPGEMAKVAVILAVAWYLRYRSSYRTLLGLIVPFVITLIPAVLILKQPDLGIALLFPIVLFAMLLAAGARLHHILTLIGLGLLLAAINIAIIAIDPPHDRGIGRQGNLPQWVHVLKPHQERRIAALLWPSRYEQREAFQQIVAVRLVGAGGMTGNGREHATTLITYNRLPEAHNDMIYAVIVNRWGLVGACAILGLYMVLISSILLVAARSKDPFARLACVGFAAMIFAQVVITVGMTIGLLPITGITLPFISYGGSSLVTKFMMIGLVLNFAMRPPQLLARPSFEYDHADALFQ